MDRGRFRAIARHDPGTDSTVLAESTALEWPPKDPAALGDLTAAVRELEQELLDAGWTPIDPALAWSAKRFKWRSVGQPAEPRTAAPSVTDAACLGHATSAPTTPPLTLRAAARVGFSIAGLVGAEVLLALGHALAAQATDAVLAILLVNAGCRTDNSGPDRVDPTVAALRALAIVAVSRVLALALPVRDVGELATQCAVAGAIGVAALQLAPVVGVDRRRVFALPPLRVFCGTALGGLVVGLAAYFVGAPALWSPGDAPLLVLVAVVTAALTGVVEEIVFRGLVQLTLWRLTQGLGALVATLLFACTYLGFDSVSLLMLAALAGLLFAGSVVRSGVAGAALAGHALLAVGAAVAWPAVLGPEPPIELPHRATVIALGAALVLGALLLLKTASSVSSLDHDA